MRGSVLPAKPLMYLNAGNVDTCTNSAALIKISFMVLSQPGKLLCRPVRQQIIVWGRQVTRNMRKIKILYGDTMKWVIRLKYSSY